VDVHAHAVPVDGGATARIPTEFNIWVALASSRCLVFLQSLTSFTGLGDTRTPRSDQKPLRRPKFSGNPQASWILDPSWHHQRVEG
jgi:hypothetical protein